MIACQLPTGREGRGRCWLVVVMGMGLLVAGCDSGPKRYDYQGKATFAGNPIPRGEVRFAPDTANNNSGPGSVALIKDGVYQTQPGQGLVGGAYVVSIAGFDGKPIRGRTDTRGNPLFKEYKLTVDFPHQSGIWDVDVPPPK
jgi:hypothetical protein